MMQGQLVSVQRDPVGVETIEAVAAGALVVPVVSALDLDETGGGALVLPDGSSAAVASANHGSGTVTLAAPLPVGLSLGDWLMVPDAFNVLAKVSIDSGEVDVDVPDEMQAFLPERIEQPQDGPAVLLDLDASGALTIVKVFTGARAAVYGDPDGARVEIGRDDGVEVWTIGPNGMPYRGTKLSAKEVSLAVMGQDGTMLAGIDPLGNVTGRRVDVAERLTIRGTPFLGLMDGGDQPGWSDNGPRGIIARNEKIGVPGKQVATGVEARNISVSATLRKGRLYRIKSAIGVMPGTANSGIRTRIRYATGSAYPTTSSPECGPTMTGATYYTGGITITYLNEGFYQPTVDQRVTFLITYQGLGGATPTRYDSSIYIEDVGPATTVSGGSDDDTSAQVVYQSVWRATASRQYRRQDGDKAIAGRDGFIDTWYSNASPPTWDSSAWIYGGGAVESTDALELGKTMGGTGGALVGATLIKSEVFIKNKVWYGASSANVALSSLASATLPATKAIEATLWSPQKLAAGQGMWVEVPTTWFTNGANLGVCIGDRDSAALNGAGVLTPIASGTFHNINDAEPPLVRHTYSR